MIEAAITDPRANGGMVVKYTQEGTNQAKELTVPYRTIGFPHSEGDGDKTFGNFRGDQSGVSLIFCQPRQRGRSDWHSEAPAHFLREVNHCAFVFSTATGRFSIAFSYRQK